MMNVQQNEFAARIQRIQNSQGSFRSTLYVGDQQKKMPGFSQRKVNEQIRKVETFADLSDPAAPKTSYRFLATPMAGLMGLATVILMRAADFHLPGLSLTFGNGAQTLVVLMTLATAFAIMLGQVIGLSRPQHVLAAYLGVMLGLLGLQNVVQVAPDQFAQLFSADWVAQMQAIVPGNSLVVAGVVYPFG